MSIGDPDPAIERWFLSPAERGNPDTVIDRLPAPGAWAAGCSARPLVHGVTYFRRLYEELCALRAGDRVFFTDWCGDADQRLLPGGPAVGAVLTELLQAGVEVRGLLWRSHPRRLSFFQEDNEHLGRELNDAGGQVLLDQRVRLFASHHQKLFIIQHQGHREQDVAFVGGIDLCHGRRDDPQQAPMDPRYRGRAPWHDAALELHGPVVGDLLRTFVERWEPRGCARRSGDHPS